MGKRARRLAACEAERHQLLVCIEAAQLADRSRATERPHHARRMPATRAKRRVVRAVRHAHRGFQPRRDGSQQRLAAGTIAFGNRQRGRYHLRRGVIQRRAMHVAYGDGSDQIAVEQRRACQRQFVTAEYAGFTGSAQCRRQAAYLFHLVAVRASQRAGDGVEKDVFDAFTDRRGDLFVLQPGDEGRKSGGGGGWHGVCRCLFLLNNCI